jgi:gliding motility-associated-like protein
MYQWLYVEDDFVVYAPNTFTPDGNGRNELFNIKGDGIDSYELLIFNRWGTLIATVTDFDDGWDGTYDGFACQDGVYVWVLRAIDYAGVPRKQTGHVTLLR